jgi:site-specific DNA recombinase
MSPLLSGVRNAHKLARGDEFLANFSSSEEQRERETIEIQREFLQEYCRLYALEVVQIYADDGVSGTVPLHRTDDRGLLQVVPEEAELVREIIENVAEGSALYAEAKRLNDLGLATPGWRYGNGKKRPGAKLWSVMTLSNIVRQSAYSGVHRVRTNGGKDVIEQPVPAVLEPGLQERAMAVLEENSRYRNRKNDRRYLLRGLVRCATCGGACTGHNSTRRGKKYYYYACRAAKTYNFGLAPPHKASFVSAEWLEELVWSDVRRFLEDPGEVLERLREQLDAADDAGELEARRKELAKRLAARQAEKDRYVRAYAQGHISEEELDAYLVELKKQIDNLRVSLASIEVELSERQVRTALTDTTRAWLL